MEESTESINRKPNWLILKEAAQELMKIGKTVFTRKELTMYARKLDPSRSEASLDFEIDLVTVNSNSKDKYRDPDKLFLYRIDRGRYTLFNPEIHGSIDSYILQKTTPIRRDFLKQIIGKLEEKGIKAYENKFASRPLAPNIIAEENGIRTAIWIVDPSLDPANQIRALAYSIGSSILNRNFNKYLIVIPQNLANKLPREVRSILSKLNIKIAYLKEEKRYSLIF